MTAMSWTFSSGRQANVENPSIQFTKPTGALSSSPANANTLKAKGRAASEATKCWRV